MTNFERITKDKHSLMMFVMTEVLDLSGPHIDHSINKFTNQLRFSEWLDSECDKDE